LLHGDHDCGTIRLTTDAEPGGKGNVATVLVRVPFLATTAATLDRRDTTVLFLRSSRVAPLLGRPCVR
jgi:hypothetical protein